MESGDEIARRGVDGDKSWMLTASGIKLEFLNPQTHNFTLCDIAKHTSMICRFTGATSQFYSVAQHSVFVGLLIKERLDDEEAPDDTPEYWDQILAGLLHDAEEAYVQDLSSPLKACMGGKYKWIATGIRRKVFERYGVDWEYHNHKVKCADNEAIIVERFYLMPDHRDWPKSYDAKDYPCPTSMNPMLAEKNFLEVLQFTIGERNKYRMAKA